MKYFFGALTCLLASAVTAEARAMMIRPAPIATRVATADLVVVGKVTGFADKLESVEPYPGAKTKVEYQIATFQVEEIILGGKAGMKEIRVGYIPAPPAGAGLVRPGGNRPRFNLMNGQEAMLFLTKHPSGDFYLGQAYFDVILNKDNKEFDKSLEEAKHAAKLLADPKAGLSSKDEAERVLTASVLVGKYRARRPSDQPLKEEMIDAGLSKQIMLVLADADWDVKPLPGAPFVQTPQLIFSQLGMTPAEGWIPPKDFKELPTAAKKWLKDNAEVFRIKRFTYPESTEKKD